MRALRARAAVLGVCVIGSACAPAPLWVAEAEVPERVEWLAALSFDTEGALVASSGLLRREQGATWAALAEPAAALTVVGWPAAALTTAIGTTGEAELARARLTVAAVGTPALPVPAWQARGSLDEDRIRLVSSAPDAPPLTASWLPPCPVVSGARADVDLRCPACRATVEQTSCRLHFEPMLCGVATLDATVDGSGDLAFDTAELISRCTLTATVAGATRSYSCQAAGGDTCALDVYAGEAAPVFASTSVAPLGPVEFVSNRGGKLQNQPVHGWLAGLVPLGAEVVTASFSGPTDWTCMRDAEAPLKTSTFHFLADRAPPVVVRTQAAPDCTTHLLPDPRGPGFLAVYGADPQRLGRFDAQGALEGSTALPEVPGDETLVVAAALSGDGTQVGLLRMNHQRISTISALIVVDTATLAVRGEPRLLADRADTLVAIGAADFVAFETDDAGSVRVDADGSVARVLDRQTDCELASDALSELGVAAATRVTDTSALLSARARSPALLWVDVTQETCRPMATHDRGLEPYGLVALSGGAQVAYGGVDALDDGYVGLIDVASRRVLRGATRVGRGVITRLVEGPSGALWALVTGAGTVARLERR